MNRNKLTLTILLFIIIAAFPTHSFSQRYFEFSEEKDSTATNFYDLKNNITICYVATQPDNYYGTAILIHYNKERFSSYFEFNTNIDSKYIVTGKNQIENSERQKEVHYTSIVAATGLASCIGSNWILYASLGIQYQETRITQNIGTGYYFEPEKDGINLHFGAGALYIFQSGITLQGGYDLTSDAIKLGIGFTF